MREKPVLQRILLACSRGATRLFRVNTGVAWQGKGQPIRVSEAKMMMVYPGDVILRAAQPLQMGLVVGGSDCIGWTTQHIGVDDVGRTVALFTAIEAKGSDGRVRPEQQIFIDQVRLAGGIAGVAHSEDEALQLLKR